MRILILGGTTEATELSGLLARALADGASGFEPTLSLAGRTRAPRLPAIPYRIGGFGGVKGLRHWLVEHRIGALVDATHPFAARISANAVAAGCEAGVPLGSILRPAWVPVAGDRWRDARSADEAASLIGDAPRRVFLSVGRLELPAFRATPQHTYLARTIDPAGDIDLPPDIVVIESRGPFDVEAEMRLMREHAIEVVVSKNSGGAATTAKIEAARRLGLEVVMIARPVKPCGVPLADAADALCWLEMLARDHSKPRSAREV